MCALCDVHTTYSLMESDWNHLFRDVVLDSFNNASRDEDNNLDQIYESEYVRTIFIVIL